MAGSVTSTAGRTRPQVSGRTGQGHPRDYARLGHLSRTVPSRSGRARRLPARERHET